MPCACVAPETNLLPFYVGSAGTNIKTNPKLICFGFVILIFNSILSGQRWAWALVFMGNIVERRV